MEEISIRIFGTPDYNTMLEILPPYDGMVREFNREVEILKNKENNESEAF